MMSWISEEENGQYKNFNTVIEEVKQRESDNTDLHKILDRINDRRTNRNNFFHNHEQSGLTVNEEKCLQAFLDLYKMMEYLFTQNYIQEIKANSVVKAQIVLMKLKARAYKTTAINNHYNQITTKRGNIKITPNCFGYDLCFLYDDADTFINKIQSYFDTEIMKRNIRIDKISNFKNKRQSHIQEEYGLNGEISLLKNIVNECLS